MHNFFREKLKDAYGESKFVIVVNADVRDFSKFSKRVDSAESALFIKKIFLKLLEEYFADASFFKSTGDGLIIIYDITEETLAEISNQIIRKSLKLVKQFRLLCKNEPMINFEVPAKCGIGISRGPATCLKTNDAILDYSGDTLNTASRLMDCARPEGVIFDYKFGDSLLHIDLKKQFARKNVYLKSIAEREPMMIWYSRGSVKISDSLLIPIVGEKWETISETKKLSEIRQLGGTYFIVLKKKPLDHRKITLEITHPTIRGGVLIKGHIANYEFEKIKYSDRAGKYKITVDFAELIKLLDGYKVPNSSDVKMDVKYQI